MRIPALEKNVLVYRAIQMAQFLFYSESVRRQLVDSVGRAIREDTGSDIKGAKLMKLVFTRLEAEGALSQVEAAEMQDLLEHRNTIAHHIQRLTGDIEMPGRSFWFRKHLRLEYDYAALKKVKKWHRELYHRLSAYIQVIGFDSLLFEAAEQAYEMELRRLGKRIDRQFSARKKKYSVTMA